MTQLATQSFLRTLIAFALIAYAQVGAHAFGRDVGASRRWQSVVLSSVEEGWAIDQGSADVTLTNGSFSATIYQANPQSKNIYEYILIVGKLMRDKSVPRQAGVSGYAIRASARYKNTDRPPFLMFGTYRKVWSEDRKSFDEVVVLHEDYNVVTLSRRSIL